MKVRRLLLPLLGLALLNGTRGAAAQSTRRLTSPPRFTVDQWTTVDGLPQNSVNAVAQTPDGYIWVGTFGGMARFDGLRFSPVERMDSTGRHVDRITCLAVAPDSALWVGTEDGLLRYYHGRFRQFKVPDGLPHNAVNALHSFVEDGAGKLWINIVGAFLPALQQDHVFHRPDTIGSYSFDRFLLEDREGNRWYRLPDGVGRLHPNGGLDTLRIGFGPEDMVEQDRGGAFWLADASHGLVEFRPDAPGPFQTVGSYGARSPLRARDGTLWAGTTRDGLLRAKRNLFTTYRRWTGLLNDAITPAIEPRNGSLWAGSNCGGVSVLDAR